MAILDRAALNPAWATKAITVATIAEKIPMIKDSAINIRRMSFLLSPSARRIPISLVRSATDMYMVTMIIKAETNSEIPATPAKMLVIKLM